MENSSSDLHQFSLLPLVFSVALLLVSGTVLILETLPYFSDNSTAQSRYLNIERGQNKVGLSLQSHNDQLKDCFEALSGPFGLAQPSVRRLTVINRCKQVSQDIINQTPSFSFAWFMSAHTAAELGQYFLFNEYLENCQTIGTNEQWLAELRVGLGENYLAELNEVTRTGHNKDLKLLVQSQRGVASIATRYVSDPSFRIRITDIVENLPPQDQRRFVAFVQREAQTQALVPQ